MGRPRGDTREKLVTAAFEAVRTLGYAGASSRAIGRIANVNPALVFYYFDGVDELLLTALAESSERRLATYRGPIETARSPSDLVRTLGRIYQDDLASGHIAVVSELVAASVSRPELAHRVTELMDPWVELAAGAVESVLARSPLEEPASARAIAQAAVIFYLGANLLSRLQPQGDDVGALLEEVGRMLPLLDALVGSDAGDA